MTDENNDTLLDRIADSRRSFLKKSALATGGLALGSSGAATAQVTDDDEVLDEGWKALVFISDFFPRARFTFVSGVVNWVPNYGDVRDSFFTDYNTYQIRWLNTGEVVPLFVAEDAPINDTDYDEELGFITDEDDDQNQPQVYEMDREYTPLGDNEVLITVNASPVSEEDEDAILDTQDWWQESEQDGGVTPGNGTPTGNDTTDGL